MDNAEKTYDIEQYWLHHPIPRGIGSVWIVKAALLTGRGNTYYERIYQTPCLTLLTEGRGFLKAGELAKYALGPHDLYISRPQEPMVFWEDARHPWRYYFIQLAGPLADALCADMGFGPLQHVLSIPEPDRAADLFAEILAALRDQTVPSIYRADACLYKLAALCCDGVDATSEENQYAWLDQVVAYIELHIQDGVNVDEICEACRVGRATLFRAFKQRLGITPHAFITARRLNMIKQLLRDTNLPLAIIARRCGFSSRQYFHRYFTLNVGLTPGIYRQRAHPAGDESALGTNINTRIS